MWWSLLIFVGAIWSMTYAVPFGENTCQGVVKHPVTVRVNVTEPVTFRTYTWCLRVPPRCSKYIVQMKERIKIQTEMHNRTITVCCRGYVEMEQRCVPACPPHTECPYMHCNRTNHCYCSLGYSGVFCNDPCPKGWWGKDCKKPCDCPTGFTCHHLTGDCMLDDSPGSKTTVRRAFTHDNDASTGAPKSSKSLKTSTTTSTVVDTLTTIKPTYYPTVKLPKRFTKNPSVTPFSQSTSVTTPTIPTTLTTIATTLTTIATTPTTIATTPTTIATTPTIIATTPITIYTIPTTTATTPTTTATTPTTTSAIPTTTVTTPTTTTVTTPTTTVLTSSETVTSPTTLTTATPLITAQEIQSATTPTTLSATTLTPVTHTSTRKTRRKNDFSIFEAPKMNKDYQTTIAWSQPFTTFKPYSEHTVLPPHILIEQPTQSPISFSKPATQHFLTSSIKPVTSEKIKTLSTTFIAKQTPLTPEESSSTKQEVHSFTITSPTLKITSHVPSTYTSAEISFSTKLTPSPNQTVNEEIYVSHPYKFINYHIPIAATSDSPKGIIEPKLDTPSSRSSTKYTHFQYNPSSFPESVTKPSIKIMQVPEESSELFKTTTREHKYNLIRPNYSVPQSQAINKETKAQTFPPVNKKISHKNVFPDFNIDAELSPEDMTENSEEDEDQEDPDDSYSDYETPTTVLTTTPRPINKYPIYISGLENVENKKNYDWTATKKLGTVRSNVSVIHSAGKHDLIDSTLNVTPAKTYEHSKSSESVSILKSYLNIDVKDSKSTKYNPFVSERPTPIQFFTSRIPLLNGISTTISSSKHDFASVNAFNPINQSNFENSAKKLGFPNVNASDDAVLNKNITYFSDKQIKNINIISPFSTGVGHKEKPLTSRSDLPTSNIIWIFNSTIPPNESVTHRIKPVSNWTNNDFSNFLPTLVENGVSPQNRTNQVKNNILTTESIPVPSIVNPLPTDEDFLNLTFILNSINDFTSNSKKSGGKNPEKAPTFSNIAKSDKQITPTTTTVSVGQVQDTFKNLPQSKDSVVKSKDFNNKKLKDFSSEFQGSSLKSTTMYPKPQTTAKRIFVKESQTNLVESFSNKNGIADVTLPSRLDYIESKRSYRFSKGVLSEFPVTDQTIFKSSQTVPESTEKVVKDNVPESMGSETERKVSFIDKSEVGIKFENLTNENIQEDLNLVSTKNPFIGSQLFSMGDSFLENKSSVDETDQLTHENTPLNPHEGSKSFLTDFSHKNITSSLEMFEEKQSTTKGPRDAQTSLLEVNKKPFRRKDEESQEKSYNMSEPLASHSGEGEATPWVTGILVTVGCTLLTGIVASCVTVLLIYCKKSSEIPVPLEPCIMAYQATPADPHILYSVPRPSISPDVFFCPTFSNVYAEQINRELRVLSYEKIKGTHSSEPLYAEISN